ncbi:hypothetical protein [Streptomyces griseus]|uniref:hypothetical protein n=1 Tax=Streptomyces griseus TaxID=1911 RepID=UPI0036CE4E89
MFFALAIAVVVCLIAPAGFGGYRIRRAEAGGTPDTPSQCTDSEQALVYLEDEKDAAGDAEKVATIICMQANVIVQNADCFPVQARAGAQVALDQQDQQAASGALCAVPCSTA